jgi:iron complex transport system permease protein
VAFGPTPLPVGVGTALIGVPVFIALLMRRAKRR